MALRSLAVLACLAAGAAAAQEGLSPPPLPDAPLIEAPTPLPPPGQVPESGISGGVPAEAPSAKFERFSATASRRIGMEALGAAAGVAVGVGGSLALAALTCNRAGDFGCDAPMLLGLPGGAFLPSLGVFIAGSFYDGVGGYWLSVAGATSGWLTAIILYTAVNPGNAGVAALTGLAVALLPVGGAIAGYELFSLRALARTQRPSASPPLKVTLAPTFSPGGPQGLVLQGAF